jgi:hypothetical protein
VSLKYITNLFLGGLLSSTELQQLCGRYGSDTLGGIHQSLANLDRVGAIIRKERLLHYEEGQDYAGVLFECERNPRLKVSYPKPISNIFLILYKAISLLSFP